MFSRKTTYKKIIRKELPTVLHIFSFSVIFSLDNKCNMLKVYLNTAVSNFSVIGTSERIRNTVDSESPADV